MNTSKLKRVGSNCLPHELLLKEEFAKIWNSERMRNHCIKKVSNCVLTSFGGLVEFEKPSIKTRFCFGYSDLGQGQSFNEANEEWAKFGEKQFLENNLADMKETLNLFEGKKKHHSYQSTKHLYFAKKYPEGNIYSILFLDEYDAKDKAWRFEGLTEATEEDFQKCYAAQKEEYLKFEKRLKSYLKRYGKNKLKTWTFWLDQ